MSIYIYIYILNFMNKVVSQKQDGAPVGKKKKKKKKERDAFLTLSLRYESIVYVD